MKEWTHHLQKWTSHLQKTSEGQAQKGLRCHLNLVPVSKVKTWTQQAKPVTLARSPDLLGPVPLGPGLSERGRESPLAVHSLRMFSVLM